MKYRVKVEVEVEIESIKGGPDDMLYEAKDVIQSALRSYDTSNRMLTIDATLTQAEVKSVGVRKSDGTTVALLDEAYCKEAEASYEEGSAAENAQEDKRNDEAVAELQAEFCKS